MTSLLALVPYAVRDEDPFQPPLYPSMAAAGSADNLSQGRLDYKIVSMLITVD